MWPLKVKAPLPSVWWAWNASINCSAHSLLARLGVKAACTVSTWDTHDVSNGHAVTYDTDLAGVNDLLPGEAPARPLLALSPEPLLVLVVNIHRVYRLQLVSLGCRDNHLSGKHLRSM